MRIQIKLIECDNKTVFEKEMRESVEENYTIQYSSYNLAIKNGYKIYSVIATKEY